LVCDQNLRRSLGKLLFISAGSCVGIGAGFASGTGTYSITFIVLRSIALSNRSAKLPLKCAVACKLRRFIRQAFNRSPHPNGKRRFLVPINLLQQLMCSNVVVVIVHIRYLLPAIPCAVTTVTSTSYFCLASLLALNREISVCAGLRGGAERTRTSRQISVCAGLRGWAGRTRTSNQTIIKPLALNIEQRVRCGDFLASERALCLCKAD
jgi:hypothetical protein